ncbi:hypothetical protein OG765_19245 [Streptomyces sp. NBC_00555]|uniref:hypothetical protein n=1 Tax=Streptomyces sp. NBC_00555 TaxID=2903662 RepID=UPI002258B638|nr:hypothetical protein [Streptomyces sp. NBC_00555]MCX5013107.1 hypothetical protein [Streptomyces sp. NBC_00555]
MRPQPGYADDDTLELPRIHVASPSAAEAAGPRPVFVDSSGRRQRRVRRLGWLLVVPAAAYVVLVLSSLSGGPTLRSPFLPAPRGADAAPSKAPAAGPGPSASTGPRRSAAPAGATSQAPAPTGPGAVTTTGSGAAPTAGPALPSANGNGNGASPGSGSAGQGKPTARPGHGGGKPTARP